MRFFFVRCKRCGTTAPTFRITSDDLTHLHRHTEMCEHLLPSDVPQAGEVLRKFTVEDAPYYAVQTHLVSQALPC